MNLVFVLAIDFSKRSLYKKVRHTDEHRMPLSFVSILVRFSFGFYDKFSVFYIQNNMLAFFNMAF